MSKLEQAARQALEALETLDSGDSYKTHNAAAALREALAEQAEQEPVAEVDYESVRFVTWLNGLPPQGTKLYAAPVRTKDLTDDEIFNLNECESSADIAFAHAVIAAYKEKNQWNS